MDIESYANNSTTQLRKGFLAYCVLLICAKKPSYTGDIIKRLKRADLMVVEGTIYPLLNRLQKYRYLQYEWQESGQGPPRKYYSLTEEGEELMIELKGRIQELNSSLKGLEKGVK